jgi:hypothetical protein
MTNHNSQSSTIESPKELQNFYAGLIGGTALYETDVWGKHAEAWGETTTLEITQGNITGTFTQDDIEFALGSRTAALSVAARVKVQNDEERRLELFLRGKQPAFTIKELPDQRPAPQIEPAHLDYTRMPIDRAFDWDSVVSSLKRYHGIETTDPMYLVVFRSQLKEGADVSLLLEHDTRAHQAAQESSALIHYFGGEPDEQGRAVSFCLWNDEAEAKAISKDSRHIAATKMISMYESYSLEKYDVYHDNEPVLLVPRVVGHRPTAILFGG